MSAFLCLLVLVAVSACETVPPSASCARTGVCAAGEVCDRATGECRLAAPSAPELSDVGRFVSAAAGPDGIVYLAARADDPRALVAGRVAADSDTIEWDIVVSGPSAGLDTSVAVGLDDQPRIAYFDGDRGSVGLATYNGTNWVVETVVRGRPETPVGEYVALAVDDEGREVVAFRDASTGGLAIATRGDRSWEIAAVDVPEDGPGEAGGRGFDVALSMSAGRPVATSYDADSQRLRVVVPGENGWISQDLGGDDGAGTSGRHISMATDPLGNVGLAFQDVQRGVLRVAWSQQGELIYEVVDDGGRPSPGKPVHIVGAFASLTFGRDGTPRVAYQDGADASLMIAVREQQGWTHRVLDDRSISGHGVALVTLSTGELLLIHRRVTLDAQGHWTGSLHVVRP